MLVKCRHIADLVDALKHEVHDAVVKTKRDLYGNVSEIWIRERNEALHTIWISPTQFGSPEIYCDLQASSLGKSGFNLGSVIARFEAAEAETEAESSLLSIIGKCSCKLIDTVLRTFDSRRSEEEALRNAMMHFESIKDEME